MGSRIEHSVQVKCNPQRAWEIYSDWKRWRSWNGIYGDIRWVEGEPWVAGSRLEVDLLQPRPMTVKQVLTVCEPLHKVVWVGHGVGVTYEQWVSFSPRRAGGTHVYVWIELTGMATQFFGKTIEEVVRDTIVTWFEAFRAECDLGAATEAQRSASAQP